MFLCFTEHYLMSGGRASYGGDLHSLHHSSELSDVLHIRYV